MKLSPRVGRMRAMNVYLHGIGGDDLDAAFEWLGLAAERDELIAILHRPPELQDWTSASPTGART